MDEFVKGRHPFLKHDISDKANTEDLAKQGNIVEKLYTASSTPDGIKLCRNLGFTELPSTPGTSRKRFVLDLETSTSPLLQKYRENIKQHRPDTRKNQKTQSFSG
ncbi:MAG TPA: hypothetical protein VNG51_04785 [Ktedonobacteraceae bacterium]|nr:hypothetical protein [Ktedonobacteraceae bacterium]